MLAVMPLRTVAASLRPHLATAAWFRHHIDLPTLASGAPELFAPIENSNLTSAPYDVHAGRGRTGHGRNPCTIRSAAPRPQRHCRATSAGRVRISSSRPPSRARAPPRIPFFWRRRSFRRQWFRSHRPEFREDAAERPGSRRQRIPIGFVGLGQEIEEGERLLVRQVELHRLSIIWLQAGRYRNRNARL
jgi:hypothetical protein